MVKTNILNLLKNLVEIPSVSGNEKETDRIIDYCRNYLPGNSRMVVETYKNNGVSNLLVRPKKGKAKLLLNAHLDVVPASRGMFYFKHNGKKATGRGVYDMKGAAAVMIEAVKHILEEDKTDNFALALVTDEEIGGMNGTKYLLNDKGLSADFVVAGEPTNLDICVAQKGILWLELTEKGISAHGSRPWEGKNSNIQTANNISRFYKDNPELNKPEWKTTYNLSMISGGNTRNVIPSETKVFFDIRRIEKDDPDKIIAKIKTYFTSSSVKVIFNENCLDTNPNNFYVKMLSKIVEKRTKKKPSLIREHFASDARFYTAKNIPAVNFGPKGGGIHQDDEWVDIDSLVQYYYLIREFTKSF